MYKITCKTKRFIYIAIRKRLEDIEFSMSIFPRPWRLSHLRAFNMLPFVCQIRRLYTTENLRDRIIPYSNYNHHIYYSYMKTVMRVDIIQFMQWCIRFLLMLRPSYFCQARELHADHSGLLKIFQKKTARVISRRWDVNIYELVEFDAWDSARVDVYVTCVSFM